MRVKIVKNTEKYKRNQVITLKKSFALDLIKKGVAILSKDMVDTDVSIK